MAITVHSAARAAMTIARTSRRRPADGNIYVRNLRTAKATDLYILKGDPNGEIVEFSMSQHGFRYVELTFPGSPDAAPPSLSTVSAMPTLLYATHGHFHLLQSIQVLYCTYLSAVALRTRLSSLASRESTHCPAWLQSFGILAYFATLMTLCAIL